jgi:hypothetical protein
MVTRPTKNLLAKIRHPRNYFSNFPYFYPEIMVISLKLPKPATLSKYKSGSNFMEMYSYPAYSKN